MAAGPDGVEGPVVGVDHDGLPGLVAGAVVETGREGLWIRARVSRSPCHFAPPLDSALPCPEELPNSYLKAYGRFAPSARMSPNSDGKRGGGGQALEKSGMLAPLAGSIGPSSKPTI